ncbi:MULTISPECIES: galactokinase [Dictyoglomus]|jgi:galactokinase|uniref:Galactokinase n=1 Tax=Dictyoglomus turgidum (strain DSM 6724 / Z-1310) TaxID=515635 RepID=B8E2X4_DICTD|nr:MULTISPECIES: galactokinase [Dictyoglomus]ACK42474.1 galactokinase [Dictyoglomus turgidum DSM 6724]HBU32070.1 galactokinase [Dictyoglomus sp.]
MRSNFEKIFGSKEGFRGFRAPGRVNLIGEHTDYHYGFVLPISINKFFYFYLKRNTENKFRVFSENFNDYFEFDYSDLIFNKEKPWVNYLMGVINEIRKIKGEIPYFDAYLYGEIPMGAGLSSSAAYEVSVAYGISEYFNLNIEKKEIAKLSQRAENNFVGAPCGIMDQFIATFGRENTALLIDTLTLDYEHIPFDIKSKELRLAVVDTKVKHSIAGEGYSTRRREGEEALKMLQKHLNINSLRELDEKAFELSQEILPSPLKERVAHVYNENKRVLNFVNDLKNNKWENLPKYMLDSHLSLKNLYEVTCEELDFLVEKALEYGAFASRMTGGGFGGSTINLVPETIIEEWIGKITTSYEKKFGFKPDILILETSNGVREV